jgi:thiol-disulfide isomerase/thioredoxin
MAKNKDITMSSFFDESNIEVLTNAIDLNDTHLYIGSSRCPYSKLAAPQFALACKTAGIEKKCKVVDTNTPEGQKIVQDMGLNVEAVPTVIINGNKNEKGSTEIVGMKLAEEYKHIFDEIAKEDGEKEVGSAPRVFPP